MGLTTVAVLCFVLAALAGLAMALRVFGERPIPWPLAFGHGALGAAGLAALLIAVLTAQGGGLILAGLGVLLVAALGGFFLLSFHVRGRRHPKVMVVVHALAALTGVGLVVAALVTATAG